MTTEGQAPLEGGIESPEVAPSVLEETILASGKVSQDDLRKVRRFSVERGERLERVLVDLGFISEDDLLFHDEQAPEPSLAFMLARMRHPEFPEPVGVFRSVDRPVYDQALDQQVTEAIEQQGPGDLETLFSSGDTWTVK